MTIEDVYLTGEQRTEWDGNGDARIVIDENYQRQSMAVAAIDSYSTVASSLTPEVLEELRGDIETAIRNNRFTEPPITVEVSDIDRRTNTVTVDIKTQRRSLSLSQTLTQ